MNFFPRSKNVVFFIFLCFFSSFLWGESFQEKKPKENKKENLNYLFLMQPLKAKNQFPFYLPFLFMPMEQAAPSFQGFELKTGVYLASTFLDQYACHLKGEFDAETYYLFLEGNYTFSNGIQLRGLLGFVFLGAGFLDAVIENFHHALKLPNGGREAGPSNRFLLTWQNQDAYFIDKNPINGFLDPAFFVKIPLWGKNPFFALSGGVKIPFSSKNWVRSGTFDLGLTLHFEYYAHRLYLYSSFGSVFMLGKSFYEKALSFKRPYSVHGGIGIGFRVSKKVSLFNQFYIQTSPYKTGVKRIDNPSIVHSFGVRWHVKKDFLLQITADEDTFTYAMADIAFLIQGELKF